jgi:hypothetical protein
VGEFIDAVRKTMRAQRTGTTELAASTARQHEAMQRLSYQAKILVGELGRALSPDLVRRMSWTRLGAAADPPARAGLRQGTLDAEHAAPDLAPSVQRAPLAPGRNAARRRELLADDELP